MTELFYNMYMNCLKFKKEKEKNILIITQQK